jgi:hypothetical protein
VVSLNLEVRNAAMYARYQAGDGVADLVREFGLSRTRVDEIIRRARRQQQAERRAQVTPDLITVQQVGHRAMRALRIANLTRWRQLRDVTQNSLLRIPGIGPSVASTIIAARSELNERDSQQGDHDAGNRPRAPD